MILLNGNAQIHVMVYNWVFIAIHSALMVHINKEISVNKTVWMGILI